VVRYRTDGRAPTHPLDGWPLLDRAATPGGSEMVTHSGLTNGTAYHYAVFALDGAGNVAQPATAQAVPQEPTEPLGEVQNLRRTDVVGY
jgi:chitodextrinase